MARREWTNHEVAYLARWYGDKPATEIANTLGRTKGSVMAMAKRSGLRAYRGKFNKRRICRDRLKLLAITGLSITEIAREMGADRSSIRYIVNREMGAEIRAGLAEAGRKRMTEAGRRANEVRHA